MTDKSASHSDRVALQREEARLRILRSLAEHPDHSQRSLSREVGISLGAVNFLLNALIEKGHVKLRNFQEAPHKLQYAYVLTPQGIAAKARLTSAFLQRKRAEYDALRLEIEALEADLAGEGEGSA